MSFQISPWDAKKVEAELKKRGLNPIADNDGKFQSFRVKDPDGFDVQISNGAYAKARAAAKGKPGIASAAPRAVRGDELAHGVARSHLLRRHELQGERRVVPGAPRLDADGRRRQPERDVDLRGLRQRHHSRRQSR